jgi:nucleotide-binding universal stress UspA family protein
MQTQASAPSGAPATPTGSIFDHVLVGIDETPESLVAAAQARVLRAPHGRLVLLAVAERYLTAHAGLGSLHADDDLVAGTETALAQAKELVDADEAVLSSGRLVDLLCADCVRRGATLVAVGVRPHRRLSALTFGGHDVEALREVRCALLLARPGWGPSKPDRILVGVDGSREARAAEATARALAARLDREIVPVVGLGDVVDPALLRAEREDALLDPAPLTEALATASTRRSLVVIGRNREDGRRGRSLAEGVVYAVRCSVLVVPPTSGVPA